LQKQYDKNKAYPLNEAVALVKKFSHGKFDETVELHIRLGIDPKKGDQLVRGTVVLPHSFGKGKVIAAFVSANQAKEAKDAGADEVFTEENFTSLKDAGKINFEVAVATPDVMKLLAPLDKILGPKGLMPSPKNETITTNLKKTIAELKKGKVSFKNDDTANLHQAIAKTSMSETQITENLTTLLDSIKKCKPETSKGIFLRNVVICSSMGPAVKLEGK